MNIIIFLYNFTCFGFNSRSGTFFTARYFGIRVDEFGLVSSKIFSIKRETEYSFNLLPIGGFVRILSESPDEESINGKDADKSLINKPKYQQALVLLQEYLQILY